MKKSLKCILWNLLLLGGAVLVAVFGWGNQYPKNITPLASHSLLTKIHGDFWMEQGARLELPGLLERGNVLRVQFHSWHPENQPAPQVTVRVCGVDATAFRVQPPFEYSVYLSGECEPRKVEFEFAHVFQAAPNDSRLVGAQVRGFQVQSKLGFPIVDRTTLLLTVGALFGVGLLLQLLLRGSGSIGGLTLVLSTVLMLLLAFLILCNASFFEFRKVIPVWAVLVSVLAGMSINRYTLPRTGNLDPVIQRSVLLIILVIGVTLRVTGLGFGLPHIYHPDEYQKYLAVMRMDSYGDLNPRYFLHPSILLYTTYGMNFIVQAFSEWSSWDASVIFAGRIVSCLAGCISILLIYYIGRGLVDRTAGLIAAAFLAVFPLHVACSRYVKEDALLTFFVLSATALVIKALVQKKHSWLLLAGLCTGFAASVKYSGLISFFVLWGYPWLVSKRFLPDRAALLWTIFATSLLPIGFLIGTPYSLLDYPTFLEDFASERDHMLEGHSSAITATSQFWMFHVRQSLVGGLGIPALGLALVGFGLALKQFRIVGLYIIALILLFYLPAEYVRAKPAPQPERYVLPAVPFIALLLGFLWQRFSGARIWGTVLSILLLVAWLLPFTRSTQLASEITNDTRDRMASWITENIPPTESILVDWRQYGPQFEDPKFKVEYLHPTEIILKIHPDALANNPYDYLLLSSLHYSRYFTQPNIEPSFREAVRLVFRNYTPVHLESSAFGQYGFHNPDLVLFDLRPARALWKEAAGQVIAEQEAAIVPPQQDRATSAHSAVIPEPDMVSQ